MGLLSKAIKIRESWKNRYHLSAKQAEKFLQILNEITYENLKGEKK